MDTAAPHAHYRGRTTNWPVLGLLVALVVPFLALGSQDRSAAQLVVPVAIAAAAVLVTLLTTSSVRASAGSDGVVVRFGPFGLPRFHFPPARIARARVVHLAPWALLGWGIFWSPGRGLLLTLRSGPALELRLTDGRRVTVSVPDPAAACEALALAHADD